MLESACFGRKTGPVNKPGTGCRSGNLQFRCNSRYAKCIRCTDSVTPKIRRPTKLWTPGGPPQSRPDGRGGKESPSGRGLEGGSLPLWRGEAGGPGGTCTLGELGSTARPRACPAHTEKCAAVANQIRTPRIYSPDHGTQPQDSFSTLHRNQSPNFLDFRRFLVEMEFSVRQTVPEL
jgi:hypothetical protein